MRNTAIVISLVIMFIFSIPCLALHTEVYMNPTLGISMRGPADWYLEMKDNPSRNAGYFFKNPFLFAIFSKYNFIKASTWPSPLGSLLMVYVFPPENRSARMIMDQLYSESRNDSNIKIIEPPHEVKLNNHSWLVMGSHSIIRNFPRYQLTYVTLYTGGSVQVEAKSTENDDAQFRKIADTFISQIIFDNDANSLQMKTTSPLSN